MSSSSSATSSANLQTSSIYRLTGTNLYSGLDTDSIIKALVSNTQSRIDKQQQLEQIAEWKRDLYRDVTSSMQDFENTYFSYTSDTNLLSSTFFKTSGISSSSSVVSATGNAGNADSLVINSISQIASKASYNSTQQVSDEAITSGEIYDSWTQSAVGGKSLIVNYNGTDYTLTMSSSVKLDSENMSATDADGYNVELKKIVDGLNSQISQNSSLNGKVSFSLNQDNSIVLSAANSADTVGVSAYKTSSDTTSGPAFLSALGLTEGSGTGSVSGSAIDTDPATSSLFNKTVSSSSYLKFTIGSDEYTVKMGTDITILGATDGGYASAIATQLQKQIDANSDLKSKISVTADTGTGKITFTSLDGSDLSVSGGSQNLLQGLGINTSDTGTSVQTSGVDASALFQSYFGDALAGSTMTFSLDGVSKTVTFDATEEAEYSTVGDSSSGLIHYLQGKLTNLFGTDSSTGDPKIQVAATGEGGIQFTTDDSTSVLSVTSSDSSNVLNQYGALRISYGETNRVETSKTLSELAGELKQTLTAGDDGQYTISINGKTLSFDGDTTLSKVISQINDDEDMGVTVAYSQTTNSFRITADDSGSQSEIEFSDVSGNLASALFGTYDSDHLTAGKDLKMNVTINGTTTDIVRSSNTTTLDGINLTVTGTTDEAVTLSSESNVDDLADKIVDFINDYNKIIDKVNTLTSQMPNTDEDYVPLTDAQKEDMTDDEIDKWNTEAKKGLLQNDSALNGILNDLREAMTNVVSSAGLSLNQLGISTQAYDYTSGGQLVVDTDTLKEKLQSDPDTVIKFFTDEDGVSSRVKDVLDKYVGTFGGDGVLLQLAGTSSDANDTSQLTTQIKQYKSTISDLKDQLQTEEDRYWTKFTAMEQSLSILTSQSDYLTSMFSSDS
ncbi:hypothetical protein EQM14_13350 [Caproiciproducens sp. NJN-50]|uniref:flagellar filament capping protein FliD n=1 Tax=Acutalibacteraceae TaxID=3082771 RepID=UPI000FFE0E3B|nr:MULTISPECIES: flagellar filament capping protein FliD [Acutalibacteraceae]QAT50667.1 hypothetical protein EQM14_13350 [Caproiciproducens sp. NJN-50]